MSIFYKKDNKKILELELNKLMDSKIYFGPFTGLKIPDNVLHLLTISEKLGLYESCLHKHIGALVNSNIKNIIQVGGNNGYYSAGLAHIFRPQKIIVYEISRYFDQFIKPWFTLNEIDGLEIRGKADNESFQQIGDEDRVDFLFIDCEGAEIDLLNPQKFKWQLNADIIVEIHPFYEPLIISELSRKFRDTHTIKIVYDDFKEDRKIDKILKGINVDINYAKHPTHRWIGEVDNKIFTSGIFMVLKQKK